MDPNRIQCYRKENKNWATHKHQNEVFKFFEKHEKNWGFPFTYNNNETHCSNVSFCFSNTRCQHGSFSIFSICLKCVIFHFIVTISVNHFVPANRLLGLHWIISFCASGKQPGFERVDLSSLGISIFGSTKSSNQGTKSFIVSSGSI